MKAIVHVRYGAPREVLALRELDKPTPADGEVLVRVHASSANPADWHMIRGLPYLVRPQAGLRRPKNRVPGRDLAGRVDSVGGDVTRFSPGDEVFGEIETGAFAEYALAAERLLEAKPANLSFEQAAAIPLAGVTALQALRDRGRVEPGRRVLIIGAAGGVGSFAVQIAKRLGAEVTGVCSTAKLDLVLELGADEVIDYTRKGLGDRPRRYDVILQLAGRASPSELRRSLTADGTLVPSSGESDGRLIGPVDRMLKALVLSPFVSQRMGAFLAKPNAKDLRFLRELIEAGDVAPVVDRTYALSEVPEAIHRLEEGHARGKLAIGVA